MIKPKKTRVDLLLCEKGLVSTRTKAQSLIMAGLVFVGTQRVEKPSETFSDDTVFFIKQDLHPFVGRGGVKLKAALDHFAIDVKDTCCMDVGASTGGFSDCLFQSGAKKIVAIDVGYGQMDYKLRQDPRMVLFERENFRHFDFNKIEDKIDIVVVDVSFISLSLIIPKIAELFQSQKSEKGLVLMLVKPQFEAGPDKVDKGGIVKNKAVQLECVEKIKAECLKSKWNVRGNIPSPILGAEGNQEYILMAEL